MYALRRESQRTPGVQRQRARRDGKQKATALVAFLAARRCDAVTLVVGRVRQARGRRSCSKEGSHKGAHDAVLVDGGNTFWLRRCMEDWLDAFRRSSAVYVSPAGAICAGKRRHGAQGRDDRPRRGHAGAACPGWTSRTASNLPAPRRVHGLVAEKTRRGTRRRSSTRGARGATSPGRFVRLPAGTALPRAAAVLYAPPHAPAVFPTPYLARRVAPAASPPSSFNARWAAAALSAEALIRAYNIRDTQHRCRARGCRAAVAASLRTAMPSKGVDMIEARRKAPREDGQEGSAGQSTRAVGMSNLVGARRSRRTSSDLSTSYHEDSRSSGC